MLSHLLLFELNVCNLDSLGKTMNKLLGRDVSLPTRIIESASFLNPMDTDVRQEVKMEELALSRLFACLLENTNTMDKLANMVKQ
jgi:hypothetical protein